MPRGTVKSYDPVKGYGFIAPDDGGEVIFLHETEIRVTGFPEAPIETGMIVEYEITPGEAYLLATNVREASI